MGEGIILLNFMHALAFDKTGVDPGGLACPHPGPLPCMGEGIKKSKSLEKSRL
jgi:hypothetical protein